MKLKPQQRKDLACAVRMSDRLVDHVIEDEVLNWMWCTALETYPIETADGDPAIKVTIRYSKIVNTYGRISLKPGYQSRTLLEGKLYKEYSDWSEDSYWEPVDGDKRTIPQQWWARCPACDKRYHRTWFLQGTGQKDKYPRPPDMDGADDVICQKCSVRNGYRRWKLKETSGILVADFDVFVVIR